MDNRSHDEDFRSHPGLDSSQPVVDSLGTFKGLTGLRVADSSIMPKTPSTVTNLTTIVIAQTQFQLPYS